jgi:threonine aldolase
VVDTSVVEAPVNLRGDNVAGIAPETLVAIEAANAGSAASYGADPITARLQEVFAELFETRCLVQPVASSAWSPPCNAEAQIDAVVAAARPSPE